MLEQTLLEDAMRRALALARRGPAADANPQVGCVVLDPGGRIVAEGCHLGSGTPHAEVAALAALPAEWRALPADLTAVVTLEPCNHTGRTGPCADALASFGIGAVAYALDDPGAVSGRGAQTLRDAGVEVRGGVLADGAEALLRPWLAAQDAAASSRPREPDPRRARDVAHEAEKSASSRVRRPHVTVKWAQTIDGRAAATDGSSRWITGEDARDDVHRRRAEADAILVGTGTLIADDPSLTARNTTGELLVPADEQPIPVVVGHREIPAGARVRRHPALDAHGLGAPIRLAGDDLAADLAALADRGVRRVFVEGGPGIASALVAAGLVDDVLVYIAPALLGGPRLALGDLGIASIDGIERLHVTGMTQLGHDLLIKAQFTKEQH